MSRDVRADEAGHFGVHQQTLPYDASNPPETIAKFTATVHETTQKFVADGYETPALVLNLIHSTGIVMARQYPDEEDAPGTAHIVLINGQEGLVLSEEVWYGMGGLVRACSSGIFTDIRRQRRHDFLRSATQATARDPMSYRQVLASATMQLHVSYIAPNDIPPGGWRQQKGKLSIATTRPGKDDPSQLLPDVTAHIQRFTKRHYLGNRKPTRHI